MLKLVCRFCLIAVAFRQSAAAQHYYIDLQDKSNVQGFVYHVTFSAYGTAGSPSEHTFVTWQKETPQGLQVLGTFGFYPKGELRTVGDYSDFVWGSFHGNLDSEFKSTIQHADRTLEMRVDKKEFDRSWQVKTRWETTHPDYGLLTNNCTDFVHDVGVSLGIEMPSRGPLNLLPESYLQSVIDSLARGRVGTTNGDSIEVKPNGDYRIGKTRFDAAGGDPIFTGKERVSFRNGPVVEGYYDHGTQRGPLTYFYPSGQIWFRNNNANPATSILQYENRNILFDYDPKAAKQHGTMLTPDGSVYSGESQNGIADGIGGLLRPDQTYTYGRFTHGTFAQFLPMTLPDGSYQGPVRNGLPSGFGTRRWRDGTIYEGNFDDHGMFGGSGDFRVADGRRWTGQFVRGIIVQGTLTHPDGTFYRGGFANDGSVPLGATLFDGQGRPVPTQPPPRHKSLALRQAIMSLTAAIGTTRM